MNTTLIRPRSKSAEQFEYQYAEWEVVTDDALADETSAVGLRAMEISDRAAWQLMDLLAKPSPPSPVPVRAIPRA